MADIRRLIITLAATAGFAGIAVAAGGNDNNAGPGSQPTCPAGYVAKNGQCVRVGAGVLPDKELYAMGRAFALAGHYKEALPILEAVSTNDDSMVLTMRGFARRKLGDIATGLKLYDQALALDPNNVNTLEYLGEYYVEIGRIDLARPYLASIGRICGNTDCEQYEDLEKAISTGVTE